jgi:uncharacterized membrane protein
MTRKSLNLLWIEFVIFSILYSLTSIYLTYEDRMTASLFYLSVSFILCGISRVLNRMARKYPRED